MENKEFYFVVLPQDLEAIEVVAETFIDEHLMLTGQLKFEKPLKLIRYSGHNWHDFISNDGNFNYIVSQKVVDILIENKITGWSVFDVEVEDTDLKYYGFCVTGKVGPLTEEKSPGWQKGYKLEYDTWDGSDFFIINDTCFLLVTEKVKRLFEKNEVTNIVFINIKEASYYNRPN